MRSEVHVEFAQATQIGHTRQIRASTTCQLDWQRLHYSFVRYDVQNDRDVGICNLKTIDDRLYDLTFITVIVPHHPQFSACLYRARHKACGKR